MRVNFLLAMRNVANSVTVVTTDGSGGKQGATVSSFCSVSADPPTLLVCLNKESRVHEAVLTNKTFCVNVLPAGFENLAQRFAGFHDKEQPDRFAGIELETAEFGLAVFPGATAFLCDTQQAVASGSHTVFIGEVKAIHNGKKDPLIYLNGRYRKITE